MSTNLNNFNNSSYKAVEDKIRRLEYLIELTEKYADMPDEEKRLLDILLNSEKK
jgi:hypothetical protein